MSKKAIQTPREVNPLAIWCSSFLNLSSAGAHLMSSLFLKNCAYSRILEWDGVVAASCLDSSLLGERMPQYLVGPLPWPKGTESWPDFQNWVDWVIGRFFFSHLLRDILIVVVSTRVVVLQFHFKLIVGVRLWPYALCTVSISLVVAARDETTPDCRSRPAACPPEHPLENTLGCIPSRARSLPSLFCHLMVQTLISSNRERRQTTTSQQSRPAAALNKRIFPYYNGHT